MDKLIKSKRKVTLAYSHTGCMWEQAPPFTGQLYPEHAYLKVGVTIDFTSYWFFIFPNGWELLEMRHISHECVWVCALGVHADAGGQEVEADSGGAGKQPDMSTSRIQSHNWGLLTTITVIIVGMSSSEGIKHRNMEHDEK